MKKSMHLITVVLLSALLLVLATKVAMSPVQAEGNARNQTTSVEESSISAGNWPNDPVGQIVFLAVLEGLYTDGVPNEVVDLIIPRDPTTGMEKTDEHFVRACPLCQPALNAFLVYRKRPNFVRLKEVRNTFGIGRGLKANLIERLKSGEKNERLLAVEDLINSWVSRRLDLMRLTPEERAEWSQKIEARREEGMRQLNQLIANGEYTDWRKPKKCAVCDGTSSACKLPISDANNQ